jgi:hypothetical protein
VAVGYYDAKDSGPVVATLSDGTWTATTPPLPGDAAPSKTDIAYLTDVACPAPGTCIATGRYEDKDNHGQALILTLAGGTWRATRAPLPADAVPTNAPTLVQAACPAAGSCVVIGQYARRGDVVVPFADTLSAGTWRSAPVPLPAGTTTGGLTGISCWAPGNCMAVGYYTSGSQPRYLAETLSGGTWTASTPPLPAGAAASQTSKTWSASLAAIACRAHGFCTALGSYLVADEVQGAIDTLSGGTWKAAKAPLPVGAAIPNQWLYFYSAVCPAAGSCVAVGYYEAQDGSGQVLIETATSKPR